VTIFISLLIGDNALGEGSGSEANTARDVPAMSAAETTKVVDDLLLLHLLRSLKYIIKDRDLPVLVSSLWGTVKK
jgi:hypothetical protein